jgi:hypothetical protein
MELVSLVNVQYVTVNKHNITLKFWKSLVYPNNVQIQKIEKLVPIFVSINRKYLII